MPETSTSSPGSGRRPLALSTNTPLVASCMKNLPCKEGAAAVTTPVTKTFKEREALSAGSEMTSMALVSGRAGVWAQADGMTKKQTKKNRKARANLKPKRGAWRRDIL